MLPGLTAIMPRRTTEVLIPFNVGTNIGSPPAAWFDGVLTGSTSGSFGVPYGKDYGTGAAKVFTKARVVGATTRGTTTNTASVTVLLEGSNNGSTWVTLASSGAVAGGQLANWTGTATVSNPITPYRYVRVTLSNSAGDSNAFLAEIEFYEAI